MSGFDKFLIQPTETIKDTFNQLSNTCDLGLIVSDKEKRLLGTITDGDLRRAILSGAGLDEDISSYYNKSPKTASVNDNAEVLDEITRDLRIKIVPIVSNNKVVDVYTKNLTDVLDTNIVIMAGGLGSRLGDLTSNCPKPMLDVGGQPVLERIIKNFTKVGFKNIFISVNYMADKIESYFKDGEDFNCRIRYLKESKRLGTAGALSLIPGEFKDKPIIVTNGDLLTPLDFRMLSWYHKSHGTKMTICTRRYEFQVPYGVVNLDDSYVKSISEKPVQDFNVSAGVYMIEPAVLNSIPKNEYFDMPTLINDLLTSEEPVNCFPMHEQWIDIGKIDDLEYARSVYNK